MSSLIFYSKQSKVNTAVYIKNNQTIANKFIKFLKQ